MLLWVALTATAGALAVPGQAPGRQGDFAEAAREYGVPQSVLLGVSYLQSRWDAHAGEPSTAGGYGPMHLVDLTALPGQEREPGGDHAHGDARGDSARPVRHSPSDSSQPSSPPQTGDSQRETAGLPGAGSPLAGGPSVSGGALLKEAGRLTGLSSARLRSDPAANIRGGAALLASFQERPSSDPAQWYGAIIRYAGSRSFADEVLSVIRAGASRRTDDGSVVRLTADPGLRSPAPLRRAASRAECPQALTCEWMPAAYKRTGKKDYGNHDRLDHSRQIDYIIVHDTEGTYRGISALVKNPKYVSWHYTIRSNDGHVAQHVLNKDIAWHAGNWDVNSRSIGIEHEGYLAKGGTWYTEAMYRASAKLVRYLANKHDIPLDRAHILGHDNVPGTTPETLPDMHDDPGPYWDWAHYFDLLGEPFGSAGQDTSYDKAALPNDPSNSPSHDQSHDQDPSFEHTWWSTPIGETLWDAPFKISFGPAWHEPPSSEATPRREEEFARPDRDAPYQWSREDAQLEGGGSVLIRPSYDDHRPRFTGCTSAKPAKACPPHGASVVWLHTEPRHKAPLIDDIGKLVGKPSTYSVYDHSARASTGQRYAVAERRGDWTAIWYLGQKAWFHNPRSRPTAVPARGPLVTPIKPTVKVYGRAYPEKSAYRGTGVAFQRHVPLPYTIRQGQSYTVGHTLTGTYQSAKSFKPAKHVMVKGDLRYHQIQLGHRVMFVRAEDVRIIR
ncbi:N-acetylmuramoyl-L-alanine amidase [Nonomuraea sp. ZG12]|uniref:N-acetylmuramoyl-L-alanine amidase n=1 Tax=Nonomuraea sp. ZG12 TaxID=3452207 RepID=UPI003F8A46E5